MDVRRHATFGVVVRGASGYNINQLAVSLGLMAYLLCCRLSWMRRVGRWSWARGPSGWW